jgi:hypothetical protein
MTDSLDAYEAYRRGVAAADGLNNTEALAQFERAIALGPQFAMAHATIPSMVVEILPATVVVTFPRVV